jgi:two-component system NtrC family sensor kinase
MSSKNKKGAVAEPFTLDREHYRDFRRKNILRLFLTYLAPLIILTIYFYIQYGSIVAQGRLMHMKAIAENQANTLDLFLHERLVNLSNLIDDPKLQVPPGSQAMRDYLEKLQKNSEAFVDIGFFDSSGIQVAYEGPYPSLEKRNYSTEHWYADLKDKDDNFIITDIYLGFRKKPHLTIAVSRLIGGQYIVMRAALDPEEIYNYIRSLEGSGEVYTSIVNRDGYYQLVTSHIGTPLETSSFVPPDNPRLGADEVEIDGSTRAYAYSWLWAADWALIVQWAKEEEEGPLSGYRLKIILILIGMLAVGFFIITNRAKKLTDLKMESDRTRMQLEHAAKLASVGELAAGIAHEINNPLAAINEEAGLVKDLMNPELGDPVDPRELALHLDSIRESVFRCRDITRKLLGFVHKTEMDLRPHNVHKMIDEVVDGLLIREMAVSNIEVIKNYGENIPKLSTDAHQLQQVLLNIINNAVDAIENKPGKIELTTLYSDNNVRIEVSDTGKGMTPEQLEKIFMPFFTTKKVGKGTGLGLSVSYGIIKSLGGEIEVESTLGKGSTFAIVLPASQKE